MNSDQTQHQSDDEREKARDLSLKPSRPPGNVPGYTIQQFIGSGAYGEVWSGTDKKTGRRVAVKFYTRRSSEDVRQLAREVEKLVVLAADRYVVQLVDVGWDADPPFFVMDYIEHGSLEDRLKKDKTLPVDEAIDMFSDIATGMMHLHGKGILHCDLKPGNVLLDQDAVPRLADFGQSRLKSDKSASLGTLFYMAPEQADLDAIPDARWDVYSLGSLLYAMLCGAPPFFSEIEIEQESNVSVSERLGDYQRKIKTAAKPSAHRKVPGVDRALAEIIDRAIEVDPKKRFPSVQSLLLALRQREIARARRPLLVLGLLGPLLLLGVMSLFAYGAHNQAVGDANTAILKNAEETNKFAAKLAARSAAEQIDEYFRAVRKLAHDPKFAKDFANAVVAQADAEGFEQLEALRLKFLNPADNGQLELGTLRKEFISHPLQMALERHLSAMMEDEDKQFPEAASWFVCDRWGNQVAAKFATNSDGSGNEETDVSKTQQTRGNNYSYRTYFTGLNRDLKSQVDGQTKYEVNNDPQARTIIDRPHLSAVFKSQGTFTWKIAFSMPVTYVSEETQESEIIGIVAVTAEMGDFIDFQNSDYQHAMLVDGRDGEFSGVILEHPVFERYRMENSKAELARLARNFELHSVDLDNVRSAESLFRDPLCDDEKYGDRYDRPWIAEVEPVTSVDYSNLSTASRTPEQIAEERELEYRRPTGIYVLAAEDYESVIKPVRDLSSRLAQLGTLALIFLLLVSIGMWLFVQRMLKESRMRLARAFTGPRDSSIRGDFETIGAAERKTN